jgi:hypothetical protein
MMFMKNIHKVVVESMILKEKKFISSVPSQDYEKSKKDMTQLFT